jgi:hypothetical protein
MFILLTAILASCKDELDNPFLTVSPEEVITVDNDGGVSSVTVETNVDDWSWQVDDGEWIAIETTSSGLSLTVDANQDTERRAVLHITSAKFPVVNKMLSVIQGATFLQVSPEILDIPGEGAVQDFTIASSVDDWAFSLEDGAWADLEKTATGLRLTAPANTTPQTRHAILHITSEKFPVVNKDIPISQVTGIVLEVDPLIVILPSGGGENTVTINTNLDDWSFSVTENWLTAEKTATGVKLQANANTGETELSAVLTIFATAYPDDIWKQVTVSQYSALIFEDNFDWLGAGASTTIFTSTGEKRFDAWNSTYGTTNGWTSTKAEDASAALQPWVYSRSGYVKYGKTSCGGDLITPALVAIDGTKDLVVSFKAIGYISSGGTCDDNEFNVEVVGPGTITEILSTGSQRATPDGKLPSGGQLTASGAKFMIGNYSNPGSDTNPNWLGSDYDPWAPEYAERSFVVSGATSESRIRFIGGPGIGVTATSFRFGFDDVRIVLK